MTHLQPVGRTSTSDESQRRNRVLSKKQMALNHIGFRRHHSNPQLELYRSVLQEKRDLWRQQRIQWWEDSETHGPPRLLRGQEYRMCVLVALLFAVALF